MLQLYQHMKNYKLCSIEDCELKMLSKRLCSKHLTRLKRHGDVNMVKQIRGQDRVKSPLWYTYNNMKKRCYNLSSNDYKNYGGRGIRICEDWLGIDGFSNFIDYIGQKPSSKHTLDRIDNDGDYKPGNVRWAERSVQNINQRKRKDNKTGFKGVYLNDGKYFIATCARIYLGSYRTAEEAALAYDCAAMQLYSDIAKTNII